MERAIAAQFSWSRLGMPGRTLSFFPAAVVDVQDRAEAEERAEGVRELGACLGFLGFLEVPLL